MAITGTEITGTLNYITDYTGFSSTEEEQSGNYIALKVETNRTGASTTVELLGGTDSTPVQLDSNMNIVVRITDASSQRIKVVTEKDGDSLTKVYGLTGLTLTESADEPVEG